MRRPFHWLQFRPLPAQLLYHGADILVADFTDQFFDVQLLHRVEFDFWHHLEPGRVGQTLARIGGKRGDLRRAGGAKLLLGHRLVKRSLQHLVKHFLADLGAETLPDHSQRRLAGAKALYPGRLGHGLEALFHLGGDALFWHLHGEAPLQGAACFNRYLHGGEFRLRNQSAKL